MKNSCTCLRFFNLKIQDEDAKPSFIENVTHGWAIWEDHNKKQPANLSGILSIEWNVIRVHQSCALYYFLHCCALGDLLMQVQLFFFSNIWCWCVTCLEIQTRHHNNIPWTKNIKNVSYLWYATRKSLRLWRLVLNYWVEGILLDGHGACTMGTTHKFPLTKLGIWNLCQGKFLAIKNSLFPLFIHDFHINYRVATSLDIIITMSCHYVHS